MDKLLKSRIIWLNGEVNDDVMGDLSAKVLLLSAEDPEKDIYLYINSPGGSVTAGLMFYDILQLVPNDIVTVVFGMAASMGQFLQSSGTQGKRFMTPNARIMMHQPLGGFHGVAENVIREAVLIKEMKNQLAGITAKNTGKTLEQINTDGDRDNWFTAERALEYGFVDHIIHTVNDVTNIIEGNKK